MSAAAPSGFESAPTPAMVRRAAQWQALLEADEASERDRAACLAWRQADALHELAWQRLQDLWQRFEGLPAVPARSALGSVLDARPRRRATRAAAGLGASVLILGCILGAFSEPGRYLLADHRNGGGAPRQFTLEDGTRLTLDAYTGVDVAFSAQERRIELHRGELMVDVAADAARPFVVVTPHGTARALGTRYLVRREPAATQVTVIESTVRVCGHAAPRCVDLHAGEQTRATAAGVETPIAVDAESAAAWVQRRLAVDGRPLVEVLQALQAHRAGRIRYDAARLADIRVSGVFPLYDTDRALDVLAGTLPIRVERDHPFWVQVEPGSAE